MPRQARLDAPGTLHHVMIRGIERAPIFEDDQDRSDFIARAGSLAQETGTRILAYLDNSPLRPDPLCSSSVPLSQGIASRSP